MEPSMNRCAFAALGTIIPITFIPHIENDQGVVKTFKGLGGT